MMKILLALIGLLLLCIWPFVINSKARAIISMAMLATLIAILI